MARSKVKDSEARSFRLRQDLCNQLDAYSDKTKIPRTAIVELALEDYFAKVGMTPVQVAPDVNVPAEPVEERPAVRPAVVQSQSQLRNLFGR